MATEKQFLTKLQEIKQRDVEVLLKKAYRGIWETAIKKYSDSAHFVYELLQNADDTKATWVDFRLEEDGLWFKHNGSVRFSISDPDNEDEDSEAASSDSEQDDNEEEEGPIDDHKYKLEQQIDTEELVKELRERLEAT